MNKSWLTEQKEEEHTEKNDHTDINVENVVHLVLILSLVAVFACSVRMSYEKKTQHKIELQIQKDTI